jgi:hypothetical protein
LEVAMVKKEKIWGTHNCIIWCFINSITPLILLE